MQTTPNVFARTVITPELAAARLAHRRAYAKEYMRQLHALAAQHKTDQAAAAAAISTETTAANAA